jgi:hypothetical protein
MALAKSDAEEKEKEKKKKEPKDSRNLFLAREGLVREGTQAAQVINYVVFGLSKISNIFKTDLLLQLNSEDKKLS